MLMKRFLALALLVISAFIGYFVYNSEITNSKFKFKLGLDLNGGTELVYRADTSKVSSADISTSMDVLREVIERRVNMFGVSEPVVRVEKVGLVSSVNEQQLTVELPGVTNIDQAIKMIGQTPTLEFKLIKDEVSKLTEEEFKSKKPEEIFTDTGLTGRYLAKSSLQFNQTSGEALVSLEFNTEGKELFAKITKENVGRVLAIFLDGEVKSAPVIKEEIKDGNAVISGGFTGAAGIAEAKKLVSNLNMGALPVPIELVSTQIVGATLGIDAVNASLVAGFWAFVIISLFLIIWYRLPGLLAVIALAIYTVISLAIFKLIPVTLTAAGIAGFILSLGMAVDANILIFERMKEELKRGRELGDAVKEGFGRAWLSIRDSNTSSMITAIILFFFSSTSVVKGFALVFFIGVAVSMFTAITASRTLLIAIKHDNAGRFMKFLFGNGFSR